MKAFYCKNMKNLYKSVIILSLYSNILAGSDERSYIIRCIPSFLLSYNKKIQPENNSTKEPSINDELSSAELSVIDELSSTITQESLIKNIESAAQSSVYTSIIGPIKNLIKQQKNKRIKQQKMQTKKELAQAKCAIFNSVNDLNKVDLKKSSRSNLAVKIFKARKALKTKDPITKTIRTTMLSDKALEAEFLKIKGELDEKLLSHKATVIKMKVDAERDALLFRYKDELEEFDMKHNEEFSELCSVYDSDPDFTTDMFMNKATFLDEKSKSEKLNINNELHDKIKTIEVKKQKELNALQAELNALYATTPIDKFPVNFTFGSKTEDSTALQTPNFASPHFLSPKHPFLSPNHSSPEAPSSPRSYSDIEEIV